MIEKKAINIIIYAVVSVLLSGCLKGSSEKNFKVIKDKVSVLTLCAYKAEVCNLDPSERMSFATYLSKSGCEFAITRLKHNGFPERNPVCISCMNVRADEQLKKWDLMDCEWKL